jgi:hypothetical protein
MTIAENVSFVRAKSDGAINMSADGIERLDVVGSQTFALS